MFYASDVLMPDVVVLLSVTVFSMHPTELPLILFKQNCVEELLLAELVLYDADLIIHA